ncbi:hypothetical protein P8936_13980 [Edaphobacter paludis]|uniref:O-antigen polysaccharide polymerase Wzy n=1 Tax=Edaphobacter paludis TaxID=3035702 RepID=A0AAU7D5Z5_9BACT
MQVCGGKRIAAFASYHCISSHLESERVRLPFPERIPVQYAVSFAALLCIAQLVEGTTATFSLCSFFFIIVATLAFNLAGGLTRASGGYVFFYAVLAVIVGLFWKVVLGEPGNSNLTQPVVTIEGALGCIIAMYFAVFVSRKLTRKRAFLGDVVKPGDMFRAAIGCLVFGLAILLAVLVLPRQQGSVLSALNQVNQFLPLAIILGTIAQIRKSGGKSSLSLPALLAGTIVFTFGLISFSKQGMFTPPLCWLIAAASQRYRISLYQFAGFAFAIFLMGHYLVPYSQYGRNYQADTFFGNVPIAASLLSRPEYVRQQAEQQVAESNEEEQSGYFNTSEGLFDRLQMISPDDAIINVTQDNGPIGLAPIVLEFENVIPHFLWPGKPVIEIGNMYAHEIGSIAPDDHSTGISFSPLGEAYHTEGWLGIFGLAPALWIVLFVVFDSLCGDVRKDPWGLLAIILFAHEAPEGMLGGIFYMLVYGAIGIIFAAITAGYLMPILGALFVGEKRSGLRRNLAVRSIPRRLPPVRSPQNPGQ